MKKFFTSLFLSAFFLLNFSQLGYCSSFFTYTNEEHRFSIDIPTNWHIISKEQFPNKVCQFIAVTEDHSEEFYIYTESKSPKSPTLSNMTPDQLERFVKNFTFGVLQVNDWEYLDHYQTAINGYPCLSFQFDSQNRGKIYLFVFIEESVIIKLFCTVAVNLPKREPTLTKNALQSLRML